MSVLVLPDSLSMSPLFCRFCSRRNSGWWSRLWHWTAQAETCIRHLQAIRVLRDPYAPWCLCSGAERRQDNPGGRAGSGGAGWAGGGPGVSAGLCEVLRDWGQAQEGPRPGKETFSQTEIPPGKTASRLSLEGGGVMVTKDEEGQLEVRGGMQSGKSIGPSVSANHRSRGDWLPVPAKTRRDSLLR